MNVEASRLPVVPPPLCSPSARDPDGREIAAVRGVLRSLLGMQPGRPQPFKRSRDLSAFRVNYQERR